MPLREDLIITVAVIQVGFMRHSIPRILGYRYMNLLGLSASVLAGGYRYNLITLVRAVTTLLQ